MIFLLFNWHIFPIILLADFLDIRRSVISRSVALVIQSISCSVISRLVVSHSVVSHSVVSRSVVASVMTLLLIMLIGQCLAIVTYVFFFIK